MVRLCAEFDREINGWRWAYEHGLASNGVSLKTPFCNISSSNGRQGFLSFRMLVSRVLAATAYQENGDGEFSYRKNCKSTDC